MIRKLIKAVRDNDISLVEELLKQGVTPNCRDHVTPLHVAVRNGNVTMVEMLLTHGANPNTRSLMGHTALQFAMTCNHEEPLMLQLVELLLKYGATADTNGSFRHHFSFARETGSKALCRLLGAIEPDRELIQPVTPEQHQEFLMRKKHQSNAIATSAWAGLMVGDALGAPAEFCHQYEIKRMYPDGLERMVSGFGICIDRKAGEVTDDTQLAWCLHQALLDADGWDAAAARRRYLEWFETDPPDAGEAVKAALEGTPLADSQGNGALMRVLPIALWAAEHSDFDWVSAAREDAAITHPHPVCGDANVVYVYALLQAMQQGISAREVYESTMRFAAEQRVNPAVTDALRRAESERPDYDGEYIGWVLIALQSAFYQLLHAPDFRSALVDIVSSGGDSDTNAAIAGALLAVLYGEDSIPRPWLVCVRATNESRYTQLLPRRKDK